MKSELITHAMHARGALVLAALIAIAGAFAAYSSVSVPTMSAQGFVSPWSGEWNLIPAIGCGIEAALIVLIVVLINYLNKAYNLMRSTSKLQCTLFIVITSATPSLLIELCPGTVLCAVVLLCIAILYFVHISGIIDRRKIFLVFAILSGCTAFDAAYLVYILTMFLACIQLRLFSMRTLLAILTGVITPWVIFIGFGIVSVYDLQLPEWTFMLPDMHEVRNRILLLTVSLTLFLGICALLQNIYKIISYNAQSRALLSVITVNTLATILATVVDFDDVYPFLTLLNVMVAYQIAHMFVAILNFNKSYIAILSIIAIYLGIMMWRCMV